MTQPHQEIGDITFYRSFMTLQGDIPFRCPVCGAGISIRTIVASEVDGRLQAWSAEAFTTPDHAERKPRVSNFCDHCGVSVGLTSVSATRIVAETVAWINAHS
jgi:hypothetical protein